MDLDRAIETLDMYKEYTISLNLSKFAKDLYPDEDLTKDCALEYVREKFRNFRDRPMIYWASCDRIQRELILEKMQKHYTK